MKRPGKIVRLVDGRKGIVYSNEQIHKEKLSIALVDNYFQPIISEKTNKQSIVFKLPTEVTLIGYVD